MKRILLTSENWQNTITEAASVLSNGGLVVFPSDTVYGLAANALSQRAVDKLFMFKDRPRGKAVSIAVKDLADAQKYVHMDSAQQKTLSVILPGAYTIVLPARHVANPKLEAEDQTLGIRIADYPFMRELSRKVDFPYTATSANIHARGPHYSIDAFLNTLSEKKKELLDLIIDYGELPHNLPSTIVNLSSPELPALRKGSSKLKLVKQKITTTPEETKMFAVSLLKKYEHTVAEKPLLFILQGDLGAGKTVFSQGLGNCLQTVHVVSPTFVLYYEYETKHSVISKLHHFDLYRVENTDDIKLLEIEHLLQPKNLLVFEWGERIGSLPQLLNNKPATVIFIQIDAIDEKTRKFTAYEL